MLRTFADTVLDFIYPPTCLACSSHLPNGRERLCRSCWDSIPRVTPTLPLYLESREKVVASGIMSDLISLFVFEKGGAFQHLVHALKYQGFEKIGRELGKQLGERVIELGLQADLLLPVPLHRRKLRERGYNQADAIARGMQMVMKCDLTTDLLRRARFTVSQTTLTLEERKKNMENAFEVVPSRTLMVKGASVIIVDDVLTTGATLISCATALREAGVERVIAASVALAE